jgi:hypothetical protein
LRLTAPVTVAITPDQHRQAVDLFASTILEYYHAQHHPVAQPGERRAAAYARLTVRSWATGRRRSSLKERGRVNPYGR